MARRWTKREYLPLSHLPVGDRRELVVCIISPALSPYDDKHIAPPVPTTSGDTMKPLLPLAFVIASGLLSGCPDTKIPKAPPKIPEPKAAVLVETPTHAMATKAGGNAA